MEPNVFSDPKAQRSSTFASLGDRQPFGADIDRRAAVKARADDNEWLTVNAFGLACVETAGFRANR